MLLPLQPHQSYSPTFEEHRLRRPFPSVALSLPLSSSVRLEWGRGRTGQEGQQVELSAQVHVFSRVCEGSARNTESMHDTVWGHCRPNLLFLSQRTS